MISVICIEVFKNKYGNPLFDLGIAIDENFPELGCYLESEIIPQFIMDKYQCLLDQEQLYKLGFGANYSVALSNVEIISQFIHDDVFTKYFLLPRQFITQENHVLWSELRRYNRISESLIEQPYSYFDDRKEDFYERLYFERKLTEIKFMGKQSYVMIEESSRKFFESHINSEKVAKRYIDNYHYLSSFILIKSQTSTLPNAVIAKDINKSVIAGIILPME